MLKDFKRGYRFWRAFRFRGFSRRSISGGQAIAEIAVFGSLLLLGIGVLLNYTRSIREQQLMEQQVFRQGLQTAYEHTFTVEDGNGDDQEDYGATVNLNSTIDRQSNLLFEPGRRSLAANYSILWSGAEDPPDLNMSRVNNEELNLPRKKITYFRDDDADETPDKELKLSTLDLVATIAPAAVSALGAAYNAVYPYGTTGVTQASDWNWWGKYGGTVMAVLRAVQLAYFIDKYNDMVDKLEETESRREDLEDQDEQYNLWGWRVSTDTKDEKDGIEAGKWYVKEIDAQAYDSSSGSSTDYTYNESKKDNSSAVINNRLISLRDTVNRNFKLRYDVTVPDPTVALSKHSYEYLDDVNFEQGLGSDGGYKSANAGTVVSGGQTWRTAQ